jgi:anti-anti-sigma factor
MHSGAAGACVTATSGETQLTLVGEFDVATLDTLMPALERAVASGAPRLSIELAGVDFLCVRSLSLLVDACNDFDGSVQIRHCSDTVARMLDICGLSERVQVLLATPVVPGSHTPPTRPASCRAVRTQAATSRS